MGIYYQTFIFQGRIIDSHEYSKLCNNFSIQSFLKLNKDAYIYNNKVLSLGAMDQIIERNEIKQGYVNKSEVLRLLDNNEDFKKKWEEQHNNETLNNADLFIIECVWSTYDDVNDLEITKTLPII